MILHYVLQQNILITVFFLFCFLILVMKEAKAFLGDDADKE